MDSRPSRPEPKENLADAAARSKALARVGEVISGRYRIVDLLAMGGVGAVYLAEHVHMHKHVALKVLHPDAAGLPDMVARFEREAVAGAHIQHPNVAAATDFGELPDGAFFLVLEYVRGTTLREVIKRGPISSGRAARIAKQIAAGLGAVHAMGIVHRDLKPRNVMLIEGERDVVKIIDFGIAKLELKQVSVIAASRASQSDDRITTSGAVFGTIAYLAPEAALGMDVVDARADLYALGVVLYEMLAGRHPFDTKDPVALFKQHAATRPPPIATRAPEVFVPAPLEAVVQRLLEKAPDGRYDTAEAVIEAIDAALDVGSPTAPPVQIGDATPIFPGPSMLPPALPREFPAPTSSRPEAGASASSSADNGATSNTGPTAMATAAPVRPAAAVVSSAPARRWPYLAGVAVLGLAAVAVWQWSSADRGSDAQRASEAAVAAPPPAPSTPTPSKAMVARPSPAPSPGPAVPATASPTATASAAAAAGPPFDALAARLTFRKAATARDWAHATEAFFALADHDPSGFHDPAMLAPARDFAAHNALAGGEAADRVFDALAQKLGSDGPDVLYEILRTRGGSRASARAEVLLRKADVIARATPATRIAFALRDAPCPEKAGLLDRAAAEGDERTLVVMETLAATCLGRSSALADAEKALRARLRGK